MAKEKFEFMFLAGGLMLDVVRNQLRRPAATPREEVGAASHEVTMAFETHRHLLEDADAVHRQIVAIRAELCRSRPNAMLLSGYVGELASQVREVPDLAAAVTQLHTAATGYLLS